MNREEREMWQQHHAPAIFTQFDKFSWRWLFRDLWMIATGYLPWRRKNTFTFRIQCNPMLCMEENKWYVYSFVFRREKGDPVLIRIGKVNFGPWVDMMEEGEVKNVPTP